MIATLNKLQTQHKLWKDNRFLDAHGCDTWEQYHFRFDPKLSTGATTVDDFYHGYNHIVHVDREIIKNLPSWHHPFPTYGISELTEWCKEHCEKQFTYGWHRGSYNFDSIFVINEIGHEDIFVMAFMSDMDAFNFKMVWS